MGRSGGGSRYLCMNPTRFDFRMYPVLVTGVPFSSSSLVVVSSFLRWGFSSPRLVRARIPLPRIDGAPENFLVRRGLLPSGGGRGEPGSSQDLHERPVEVAVWRAGRNVASSSSLHLQHGLPKREQESFSTAP